MKEIGEKLLAARQEIGISIDEAAEDLKVDLKQIEQLEQGDMEQFKDIYYLKYLIRDYSKYLGLNKEDLINEFNEYLFDYTSKISLEDIMKAKAEIKEKKEETEKIQSPYTIEKKSGSLKLGIIIFILALITLGIVTYFIIEDIKKDENDSESVVMNYSER